MAHSQYCERKQYYLLIDYLLFYLGFRFIAFWIFQGDSCIIRAACMSVGTKNIANECQVCDPERSNSSWTKSNSELYFMAFSNYNIVIVDQRFSTCNVCCFVNHQKYLYHVYLTNILSNSLTTLHCLTHISLICYIQSQFAIIFSAPFCTKTKVAPLLAFHGHAKSDSGLIIGLSVVCGILGLVIIVGGIVVKLR